MYFISWTIKNIALTGTILSILFLLLYRDFHDLLSASANRTDLSSDKNKLIYSRSCLQCCRCRAYNIYTRYVYAVFGYYWRGAGAPKLRPYTPGPAAHLKRRLRSGAIVNSESDGSTVRSASQKPALLTGFMTIYFQYFTIINVRLICAEVGRCATAPAEHFKNRRRRGAGASNKI